jgi:hypothetical protein
MRIGAIGLDISRAEAGTVRHQRHSFSCFALICFHYTGKGKGRGNGRLASRLSSFGEGNQADFVVSVAHRYSTRFWG